MDRIQLHMPEQTPKLLSHFFLARFQSPYYDLSLEERRQRNRAFLTSLCSVTPYVQIYQVYPAQAEADILIWSSLPAEDSQAAAGYFECFARATIPYRRMLAPLQSLWGFTRPSQYTKSRSTQEIDPLSKERKKYLVAYPFVKTTDWYLLGQETRQGIMNGHIKAGKQYPEIAQLLLYSFGLQDQEFVVVYETDDLSQFSDLVYALRGTESRKYTVRDTPLLTAVYHLPEETLALWE
jgi:chlorite dismutase